jgi:hypothetical protein
MFVHCPKCKSAATVPIVYGEPGYELMEACKYGLIHLAGCVIYDESINRHCKACDCDFISYNNDMAEIRKNQGIPIEEMNRLLNNLQAALNDVHKCIQYEYMRLGRSVNAKVNYRFFYCFRDYHTAWDHFLNELHQYGDPTVVIRHDGKIAARYSNQTARIYLIKNHSSFYRLLAELAEACHWLGRTSRGDSNDIDDLKNASVAVQNARENIAKEWERIRNAAISQSD